MEYTQAISNLEMLSQEFERLANNPKNYNSEFSYYLETISYEMYRYANELKSTQHTLI